jgi:hypothetical protein
MFQVKNLAGLAVGAALSMVAMSGAASATTVTFSFAGGSSATDGLDGNVLSFNSNPLGITLNASAYSTGGANNTFVKAWLGHYSNGLGVTNPSDSSSSPSHTVDNGGSDGRRDFVAFEFSQAIDISKVILHSYGDVDMTMWLGTLGANNNFTGTETFANNLGGLNPLGNFNCTTNCSAGNIFTHTVTSSLTGNYLIVAAHTTETTCTTSWSGYPSCQDKGNDNFKIRSLEVDYYTNQVPEPATLALLGAGLLGLGAVRRRKTA